MHEFQSSLRLQTLSRCCIRSPQLTHYTITENTHILYIQPPYVYITAAHASQYVYRMLLIIQYMYAVYIGETGRELKTQIAEHKAAVRQANTNNAIASHVWNLRHNIQWKETSVLKHEGDWY